MLADFRHALRQLRQSPGFAAIAVLSLALGIGANTVVFSLVNEFLLRSLPVRNPDELVIFGNVEGSRGNLARSTDGYGSRDPATGRNATTSFPLSLAAKFGAQQSVLSDAFAFSPFWQCTVLIDNTPETTATAQLASGNFHSALGVRAQLGRTLTPDDDRAGAPVVGVISHRLWQQRFAGSPDVLGRTLRLNKVLVTIVGVTPPEFAGTGQVGEYYDLTVPLAQHGLFDPEMAEERRLDSTWWVRLMGRLAPGVTREQAAAVLEPIFVATARDGWRAAPREPNETVGGMPDAPLLRTEPGFQGEQDNRQRYATSLRMMLGLVGVVLVAACANVANLLLARGEGRRREIAVRLALGASRSRVVRQLLAESLLLAGLAAAAGTALACLARGALIALQPFGNDVVLSLSLDTRVLAFTLATSVATALLFGLAPALRATKLDLAHEFQGGRSSRGSRSWLSRSLMIVQITLSFLLLACTGLLVSSLRNLQKVDPGFNRHSLAVFSLDFGSAGYPAEESERVRLRVQERVGALPGVAGVAISRIPVLGRIQHSSSVQIPGVKPPGGASGLDARFNAVSPNFFSVLELPIVLGRAFAEADQAKAPKVGIVNQTFVQRYLGGENPVGRRMKYNGGDIEIVGVARDAKYADLRSPVPPTIYLSAAQWPSGTARYTVRMASEPAAIFRGIRTTVREIDPALPLLGLRTLDEQIDRLHQQELLFARLSGFFSATALLLSGVGLYGLMAYVVSRRTGEIGVRMALGALPRQVLQLFLGEACALTTIGIVAGVFAAWGASSMLGKMLFGLSGNDPVTYASAGALLLAVAVTASSIPALRAASIAPSEALRSE